MRVKRNAQQHLDPCVTWLHWPTHLSVCLSVCVCPSGLYLQLLFHQFPVAPSATVIVCAVLVSHLTQTMTRHHEYWHRKWHVYTSTVYRLTQRVTCHQENRLLYDTRNNMSSWVQSIMTQTLTCHHGYSLSPDTDKNMSPCGRLEVPTTFYEFSLSPDTDNDTSPWGHYLTWQWCVTTTVHQHILSYLNIF